MTATRPNISQNGSYGVVLAAKLLGIDRRTLRRYERKGCVHAHLNDMGQRRYQGRELLNLWHRNY